MRSMRVLTPSGGGVYTYDVNVVSALIKDLSSPNVYTKAKCFEVKSSLILCTQVYPNMNQITGSYKAVKI